MTGRCSGSPSSGVQRRTTLLISLLLWPLVGPATARTVGPDDRILLPAPMQADFAGVGQMTCVDPETRMRVRTTMTIVGDRWTIIGVGHFRRTVVDGQLRQIPIEECWFELFGADLKSRFTSGIARIAGAGEPQPALRPDIYRPDWAVLVLRKQAPRWVRPIVLSPIDKKALAHLDGVFMVAHHLNPHFRAEAKVYSPGCKPNGVVRQNGSSFVHSCDTDKGSSGALLFSDGPDGLRAVGINIAQSSRNRNYGQLFQPEALSVLPAAALGQPRGSRRAKK